MAVRVEILTIGTELVTGLVVNTNGAWLARRVTAVGGHVTRIVTVRDDEGEIAGALRDALSRAEVVITTGGLGPTPDDMTMACVAKALGRRLVLNEEALEMVRRTYAILYEEGVVKSPEMTPEREKMAMLPEGAEPLPNPVGAAPGAAIEHEGRFVFCLPGVPREMERMYEESVEPRLRRLTGASLSVTATIKLHCTDESSIAGVIREASRAFPWAYIKSHPGRLAREGGIHVTVTVFAGDAETLSTRLEEVERFLKERFKNMGIRVISSDENHQ